MMTLALGRIFFTAVCCSLLAPDAFACVCTGHPEPPSAAELRQRLDKDLNGALAVFIGEPIAKNSLAVRLRVQTVWKGDLGSEVVMSTGAEANSDGTVVSSSCDFSFVVGRVYLIVGHGPTNETMRARDCSFTGSVDTRLIDLLDGLVQRRLPSKAVAAKLFVAVVGSVRNPGLIEWRDGLTVAESVKLAGGAVPPVRPEFAELRLTSKVVRTRTTREAYPATPTTALLPDDEVFVAGDMTGRRP